MRPKRYTEDAQSRRPSPSCMTIDELNSSELVALLKLADTDSSRSSEDSWRSMRAISLTINFIVMTFVMTTLFAFSFGVAFGIFIRSTHGKFVSSITSGSGVEEFHVNSLPVPTIILGKAVPYTTYVSKHFQMPGSSTSHTLHIDRSNIIQKENESHASEKTSSQIKEPTMNEHGHTDENGAHLPAGQHLLRKCTHINLLSTLLAI